jgi:hypothetical protein
MRLTIGFLAFCISSSAVSASTNFASKLVAELITPASQGIHPSRRDTALRELLALNGRPDPSVTVNHVVTCPQPNGPPIYAVFKSAGPESARGRRLIPGFGRRLSGYGVTRHEAAVQSGESLRGIGSSVGVVRDDSGQAQPQVLSRTACRGSGRSILLTVLYSWQLPSIFRVRAKFLVGGKLPTPHGSTMLQNMR